MKRIITATAACLIAIAAFSQAKKPTLMVVPSDMWCNTNGYMTIVDNNGFETYIPNYQKALVSSTDLIPVISKINGLMADRGFPLKNLETVLKQQNEQSIELSAVSSKDGNGVQSNELMELRQRARADIIIQISWTVNKLGPKSSVTYTMQGLDSYTGKEVATATGTGPQTFTAETAVLLSEAVNANIDEFCDRLQNHFNDMFENGRQIAMKVNVFQNDEGADLETEYNGKELKEIIEDWVASNTVKGRYNLSDDNELYMNFEDVHIQIYDSRERPIAANAFGRDLAKYLKTSCGIDKVKVMNQGLGQCTVILFNK